MKKLTWITGILVCLMVLLAAMGAVCSAVNQIAADRNFYSGMSRTAVAKHLNAESDPQADGKVTEYIGLTGAEQDVFAAEMAAFMRGETGEQPSVLNEKEQQHMLDVRALTQTAGEMSKTYLTLAAALAVITAWTAAKLGKERHKAKLIGVLAAVTLIMAIVYSVAGDIGALGFEKVFVDMHGMLFENDLWLMNPETDILIRMMPQPLFEQALLNAASIALRLVMISMAMLAAVHFVIERMIRRHLKKDKR